MRIGLWRKLSAEELMLLNCGVGEDSWESPGLQGDPTSSEGAQPWVFFGRNDAKAETPVLWPPHMKSWLIGKDSDAGRDWGQEEKGTTEDEMAGCITDSNDVSLSELQELMMDREAWHAAIHRAAKSRTWLSDWTELEMLEYHIELKFGGFLEPEKCVCVCACIKSHPGDNLRKSLHWPNS